MKKKATKTVKFNAESSGYAEVAKAGKKPAEYPDAVWNEEHKMWTVVREGRLMGVQ